jgi:ESS family glutamate:Na+ symporter
MGDFLTQLMYCFCCLSVFLLIGTFLRATVPIFRKLFIPASVIGGFVGLLVGPIVFKDHALIQFPKEWISIWSALPGVLITPVVASIPLGMKFGSKEKNGEDVKGKTSSNVIKMFSIVVLVTVLQQMLGLIVKQLYTMFNHNIELYSLFGYELSRGYSGGHSTAGVVGAMLKDLNIPYWEVAQGVTATFATFGIIGGMIIGIISINIAARKGKTEILKKPGDIPKDLARGIQMNLSKQKSAGVETTYNSSIESLTFHFAIVLLGCGMAYGVMSLVKLTNISAITSIPVWAYAIITMFFINFLIQKLGLGNLICEKTKSSVSGICTDYAIVAAVASIPVQAVMKYAAPMLIIAFLGYIVTYSSVKFLCYKCFTDSKHERAMAILGMCTGVFLTGLMLLKICDPDYELPVLNDFSISYSFQSVEDFVIMPFAINLWLTGTFSQIMCFYGVQVIILVLLLLYASKLSSFSMNRKKQLSNAS